MDRRTVLQSLAVFLAPPKWRLLKTSSETLTFPQEQGDKLRKVAAVVFPSQLERSGVEKVVQAFELYVRDYRAGADTEHGYGVTHVRPKPPSPLDTYVQQLRALPTDVTPSAIAQALDEMKVKTLPRSPEGKSVIADLMSFYFQSSEANDLCYEAAIGRDECRGLAGSEQVPTPFRRSSA